VVLRGASDPRQFAATLQKIVAGFDRDLPVFNVRPMDRLLADSIGTRRFHAILMGVFAAVALVLGITGLYGVMSHWVNQRSQELGIRMALGARSSDLLRLVVGQGLALASIGVVVGAGGAAALMRLLSGQLYGVSPTEPAMFVACAIVLVTVAGAASYIPARRATAIDPLGAIRHD
jgi:putative ABC transport system permease protein